MRISKLYLSQDVEEKIVHKHGIELYELQESLKQGKPKFTRQEGGIYIAITYYLRYITMVFKYRKPFAKVITAYPSSESQIRKYKKK